MIRHVVMFHYKEEAEGSARADNVMKSKELLEGLVGKVPEIKWLHVGINDEEAPDSNYQLVLTVDVDTIADLSAYQVHPDHKAVAAFIKKVVDGRACVDYAI